MEYQEYIKQKLEIYEQFLYFIDEENQNDDQFGHLIEVIHKQKYEENQEEFKIILYLISEISKNHHHSNFFISKIERILSYYSEYLKLNFTKYELLKIFRKNPQILHFLFNTNVITIDDSVITLLLKERNQMFVIRKYEGEKNVDYGYEKQKYIKKMPILHNYIYYFYNNIRPVLGDDERLLIEEDLYAIDENIFDEFDKKCREGENDSYISKLIREDSIKEFIIYVNKNNLRLDNEIIPSIFETHPLLVSKKSTLIEYAAFFGSIQIFNYLRMNGIKLTPSLWIYVINGRNPDMIHILEENHIEPSDNSYIECLKESIKCHHNEIARYIENNLLKERIDVNEKNFKNNSISYGFHYYNYEFIYDSKDLENLKFPFFYACLYDHYPIVELLIQSKRIDFNPSIIQKLIIYKIKFFVLIMNI